MGTAPRFSRVLRGQRGTVARKKYLDYLEGLLTEDNNIGTRGNRPDSIKLYLDAFGLPLGTTVKIQASALVPSWNLFKGLSQANSRAKEAVGNGNTPIKLSTYRPARVVRREQTSRTGTEKKSKLTGLPYLKYSTNSNSIPFGRKDATDTVAEAFTDIVNQAKGSSTNLKFSLIEEKV